MTSQKGQDKKDKKGRKTPPGIVSDDIALKKKTIHADKKSQEKLSEIESIAEHPLNPRHDLVDQTVPGTSNTIKSHHHHFQI